MTNLLTNSLTALATTDQRARQQAGTPAGRPNAILAEPSSSGAPASRFSEAQWRNLLLGGVAAGVAFFGYGRMAYAACATDGTTITCTGDLSAGVAATNPTTTLNVNSLTTNIAPSSGTYGIKFDSTGPATIVSDTGPFAIFVSGVNAEGISSHGAGAISITHTGDVTSDGATGIFAYSTADSVTTVSTGTIHANYDGITARAARGGGAVGVTHTGDVTSDFMVGINAQSVSGDTTTVSTGTIQANDKGIRAHSLGAGATSLTHTGDVTSNNSSGIYARSSNGSVTTVSTGAIQAKTEGILATSNGAGAVSVTHTGDITSDASRGIYAKSSGGSVTTVSTGNIQAAGHGIEARDASGAGAVSVNHTGDITAGGRGIYAKSQIGSVTTVSTGNIQADNIGIRALSLGAAAVSVTHTGDIASVNERGVYARSVGGSVEVTLADGVVRGKTGAIEAGGATGTTLNLNAGSVVIGIIRLSGGGPVVLNTGPGLSISHTFSNVIPTIGNTSGNVSAASGNQIAVADISGLTAADNQLSDTLDGVSGVLGTAYARGKGQWWISGFGGTGNVDASSSAPKADHSFGGFVAGGHTVLGNGMQLGVFGGLSKSVHQASVTNGVRAESSGFFGGLYGGYAAEAFALDFALTAGSASNDGTRIVANNTVATGLETATSSYDSLFIAPELTVSSKPMAIGGVGFTPSLRVRYELMKSDGFTETGLTSGALTMGDATSHALNMRLQGAFPVAFDDPASKSALIFRTGIDARFASVGGRQATLLGVVSNDAGADNESSGGGFAGLDFTHALSDAAMLSANGELRAGTTGVSATASFGIRVQF